MGGFDRYWFFVLNGLLANKGWADFFYIFAVYGIAFFMVVALALWLQNPPFKMRGEQHDHLWPKKTVVLMGLAVLLVSLGEQFFDIFIARPRPFVFYPNVLTFNTLVDLYSFPSMHVAVAFTCALVLWQMRYRWLGGIAFVLAILIGISRVAIGVHYPTDILGGLVLGAVAAWIVHLEAGWLRQYLPK